MNFPKYFIFINDECYFSNNLITNFSFSCQIKLREPYCQQLTLLGNQEKEYIIQHQVEKELIPLLKSNLQKCTRRHETFKAIKTAYALYSTSPIELLRRLPIILIEDSLPFFNLIKVVWWMIAVGRGYKLSKEEIEELIGIVYDGSETKYYEKCQFKRNFECCITKHKDFFRMLELRKIYGGMFCDIYMINYHINLWNEKFKDDKWLEMLNLQEHTIIDIDKLDNFSKDDILLESIDYHCYPWILKKLPSNSKQLIWWFRSGVNFRQSLFTKVKQRTKEEKERYKKIEKQVIDLSVWIKQNIIKI